MTERERLFEEFEDTHFALLMEGVARKEGERLLALNEMLQDNPEAAVPESVDKWCLETIDRHFAKERRRVGLRKTGRVLRLAAVIMAISVLLFTSVFALSEDFRVATLNLMLTVTEKYTQFDIQSSDGNRAEVSPSSTTGSGFFENAVIGWIPEGFLLNYDESFHDLLADCARFEDEHGEYFSVTILPGTANLQFDTEDPESLEQVSINGKEGLCVVKYGEPGITLADLENNLFIMVDASSGVSVDMVKKIAENILIL